MADMVVGRDKCGEQRLVSLPLSRIRVIMKSSPEVSSINQEALVLTAKATVSGRRAGRSEERGWGPPGAAALRSSRGPAGRQLPFRGLARARVLPSTPRAHPRALLHLAPPPAPLPCSLARPPSFGPAPSAAPVLPRAPSPRPPRAAPAFPRAPSRRPSRGGHLGGAALYPQSLPLFLAFGLLVVSGPQLPRRPSGGPGAVRRSSRASKRGPARCRGASPFPSPTSRRDAPVEGVAGTRAALPAASRVWSRRWRRRRAGSPQFPGGWTCPEELFVQYLATYSYRHGSGKEKKALTYHDLSNTAEESETFQFLADILPKKILASKYLKMLKEKKEEEEEEEEENNNGDESDEAES